jgi:diaminopimelate decarboxylase
VTRNEWLAERFGTPLYVYDLDRVEAAHRDLRAALPDTFSLFYSFKANPHPEIARALRESDGWPVRAELCSTGELNAAFAAGFTPDECLYTGPGKTETELAEAIGRGIRKFSVESLTDLHRVGQVALRAGTTAQCLLRINNLTSASTTSIRMTGTPSQFGIDSEQLLPWLDDLRSMPGTRLIGAHFFPLSNSRDEESLIAEFENSIAAASHLEQELGLPMSFLDIGGGFSAPYASPGSRPVYTELRAGLENSLHTYFPTWSDGEQEVACESGRYLVGDCGELVTSVTNAKESRGQKFLVMDAGINTLGGMAGLGRLLPLSIQADGFGEELETATLAGPLCTPGDLLGRNVKVPAGLGIGDVVTVPNVGAYGPTASLLLFLGRPAPREVVVRGEEIVSVSQIEVSRSYASRYGYEASQTA